MFRARTAIFLLFIATTLRAAEYWPAEASHLDVGEIQIAATVEDLPFGAAGDVFEGDLVRSIHPAYRMTPPWDAKGLRYGYMSWGEEHTPDVRVDYTFFRQIVDAIVAARCNGSCR